jgi:hypothetical protein
VEVDFEGKPGRGSLPARCAFPQSILVVVVIVLNPHPFLGAASPGFAAGVTESEPLGSS